MANQIIVVILMMFLLICGIFLFWNLPDYFSVTQINILVLFLIIVMAGSFTVIVFNEFVS